MIFTPPLPPPPRCIVNLMLMFLMFSFVILFSGKEKFFVKICCVLLKLSSHFDDFFFISSPIVQLKKQWIARLSMVVFSSIQQHTVRARPQGSISRPTRRSLSPTLPGSNLCSALHSISHGFENTRLQQTSGCVCGKGIARMQTSWSLEYRCPLDPCVTIEGKFARGPF